MNNFCYKKLVCELQITLGTLNFPAEFQISSLSFPETTPILKDPGSTVRIGKHLGESTLKKELWTKFDSASTNGFAFKVSVLQDTNKGFLERLEVSCEDEI